MSQLARVEAGERDGACLIYVGGEVDLSNAREVMDAIGALVPGDASLVVVDLSGARYVDSAGLAMIFRLAERLECSRQELRLVVPLLSPIRAVVELTGMDRVIAIDDGTVPPDGD